MEVLHRLGVVTMQGYLFSKPVPPTDLELWLDQSVQSRSASWIGQATELEAAPDRLHAASHRS
jgi:hypothetical protein